MFVFNSDIVEHVKSLGHSKILACDFPTDPRRKKLPARFVYGKTTMNFRVGNTTESAMIKFRYYPAKDLLYYTDISYSNPELEKKVEKDPVMMQKIDNYVRKLLAKK